MIVINGVDMISSTKTSLAFKLVKQTRSTRSLSVTIPKGRFSLSITITELILFSVIIDETSFAFLFEKAVIVNGSRNDIISLTLLINILTTIVLYHIYK